MIIALAILASLHYRKQKAHFRFGVIVMLWTFGLSAWTLYYLQFYVKAENTRDFSRGMNRLIFLKSDTKFIANIRSVC